ncbi:MAG: N4-gp56 family major capsid protein [Gammaproteobacteria bacterium]
MAQTQIPVGHALARKLFSVATFAMTQRQPGFRKNLTGAAPKQKAAERKMKGQTPQGYPFVRVTDLSRGAGDTISVDLFNIIQGKPVMGDKKMAGRMMALASSSMDIKIDQTRGGVDPGGRMAQQRTVHNLRGIALANLSGWANRLEDQSCLVHVSGARGYDAGADWVVPLESDPDFAAIMVNTVLPPTRNRRLFAGDAGSVDALATTDKIGLEEIDMARATLDDMVFPLQPVMLDGDVVAEEDHMYVQYLTSRQWHYLQTETNGTVWRTFLANAMERSSGFSHPLFKGQRGMWNGILIKKMWRPIRFPAGQTVAEYDANDVSQDITAAVDTDRSIILGAQALGIVYGRHQKSNYYFNWHEEETDHGNTIETSIAMMGGKAKLRFKDVLGVATDHGVITMDSYAPAITGPTS